MSDGKRKVATALKYDRLRGQAPTVVAKGLGLIAEKIIESAEKSDVQVYKDETLAKQLYNLSIGDEIPEELYTTVAEVLAFIARLDKLRKK
ncbi:MAG: EscU/YscU/HrcU family type III secretion system export apparatus switch protein [Acidaminobacteraceae bacterium]